VQLFDVVLILKGALVFRITKTKMQNSIPLKQLILTTIDGLLSFKLYVVDVLYFGAKSN